MLQQDDKRPCGTTLIPRARGKPMAWDVTVPDTFAESHLGHTAREPGAAANKASASKAIKYDALSTTHIFFPMAVKTAGTGNQLSVELIQELGRCIAAVTGETRETVFLFQRLSVALQRGNAIAFLSTFDTE